MTSGGMSASMDIGIFCSPEIAVGNLLCCSGFFAACAKLSTKTDLWFFSFQNKIGSGRLMGPKGVAVDRNGHIIAVDNKACCVFIFQSNGKLVTKFGARGTADRQFAGTGRLSD